MTTTFPPDDDPRVKALLWFCVGFLSALMLASVCVNYGIAHDFTPRFIAR